MVKIKEKLNNSICFIKENPIEGTAKYIPILICGFSTLLTIISLILFTTSGGFSHQSIQVNQNFNYEGANLKVLICQLQNLQLHWWIYYI